MTEPRPDRYGTSGQVDEPDSQRSETAIPAETQGLGARIRELRKERGLIQRELAEAADLSLNAVSLIERDQTSPTVSTLERLANAMDVPLVAFFQRREPRLTVIHTAPEVRERVAVRHGQLERLGRGLENQKMEAVEANLEAGYAGGPRPQMHAGHELVYVVEGQLVIEVGERRHELEARESLMFEARIPHRYSNPASQPARALIVSWEPDGQGGSLQSHFS